MFGFSSASLGYLHTFSHTLTVDCYFVTRQVHRSDGFRRPIGSLVTHAWSRGETRVLTPARASRQSLSGERSAHTFFHASSHRTQ